MVGLSVVLEGGYKGENNNNKKGPQVISKSNYMMTRPFSASSSSSSSSSSRTTFNGRKWCEDLARFSASNDFLQYCFLCKHKLLPGKDIYMYKGDMAFCSEECRCRKIVMEEEDHYLSVIKPHYASSNYPSPCHKKAQKSTYLV